MRLAFLTDIHLDHMGAKRPTIQFLHALRYDAKPDVVVITGDIAQADTIREYLIQITRKLDTVPFYFCLGNHDFYGGSIAGVRSMLAGDSRYLTCSGPVSLTDDTALVGHDGWYDGLYGSFLGSRIRMNDYDLIAEFRHQPMGENKRLIERLAGKAAEKIEIDADISATALVGRAGFVSPKQAQKTVIIATHVPPFAIASRGPDRNQSNADWLPVMSSKLMGDAILRVAEKHPEVKFMVLCGHTHTPCVAHITTNVECRVGDADKTGKSGYGHPMWTMIDIA